MTNLQELTWKHRRHGRGWIQVAHVDGEEYVREDRGGRYAYSVVDGGRTLPSAGRTPRRRMSMTRRGDD
jgi:hypothetical protein